MPTPQAEVEFTLVPLPSTHSFPKTTLETYQPSSVIIKQYVWQGKAPPIYTLTQCRHLYPRFLALPNKFIDNQLIIKHSLC